MLRAVSVQVTPASYWKQVREACDKATAGPWSDAEYPDITAGDGCTAVLNSEMGFVLAVDAAFIALSRDAAPLALARIEELEAAGRRALSEMMDAYPWVNFDPVKPGAGLCICHDVTDRELPDEITSECVPETHDSLCVSWREALASMRGALGKP